MTVKSDLVAYKSAIATRLAGLTLQESTSTTDYDGHRRSLLDEMDMVNQLIGFESEPYEMVTELER